MIEGFYTHWCQVSDMDRSVGFYRDLLGLKVVHESPYWTSFDLGNGTLGLHPQVEGGEPPLGIYCKGWFLGLKTNDIRKLRSKLEANRVTIARDYHDVPGGVILDFQDPDGNTLEAFQSGITVRDLS